VFEENESEKRNADEDFQLFRKTCDKFRVLMQEIADLKTQNTDEVCLVMCQPHFNC